MASSAIFFDRDDTLIKNIPYLGDPRLVELFPQAKMCLEFLRGAAFELFLVSNQSGVGRGFITPQQVELVTAEMIRQLGRNYFRKLYNCFEEPDQPHVYQRKPSPHLVFAAAREFGLDLKRSFFVGDRLTDILTGRNAGCQTILVLSGHHPQERPLALRLADHVADNLDQATAIINATVRG